MSCFHGSDPKICLFCGVIKAQALGDTRPPIRDRTLVEKVTDVLTSWVFFWRPKTGLDKEDMYKQEAQRVALMDGLLTEEELLKERAEDVALDNAATGESLK